jgi:hypothetical protein
MRRCLSQLEVGDQTWEVPPDAAKFSNYGAAELQAILGQCSGIVLNFAVLDGSFAVI